MAIGAYCGFHLKISRKGKKMKEKCDFNFLKGFWVSFYLYLLRKIRQKKWSESGLCLKKSYQSKHILLLILEKKNKVEVSLSR